jgi:hypothetical protein
MKKRLTCLSLLCGFGLTLGAVNALATPVDLELVLAVDVSGSISTSEYNTQKNGYIAAFNNSSLWSALTYGNYDKIAVTYAEWSSSGQYAQMVGWTLIEDQASAQNFANLISATSRAFNGNTGVGYAIQQSAALLAADNGYEGTRKVIDVSGDGENNSGIAAATARDAALAGGVTAINGLVVSGGTSLENWYKANVMGGTNAFVVYADTFDDFGPAVISKLQREIVNPVPEPTTMLLFGSGLIGLAAISRRRSSK